ncbi:MAG: baseplate J/gp47 family protein, partial [Thiohalospira sp.]
MAGPIDLSRLPAPRVVEDLSFEEILDDMLSDLQEREPDLDIDPTDPAYKTLETAAYREMLVRQSANDKARSLLAAYASDADLDHLAATYYGVERHDDESDDSLLERMQVAPSQPSTAGSEEGYIAIARAAHSEVRDVQALTRSAGIVAVPVLSTEGDGTPSQEVLDAVDDAVQDQKSRPLNDRPVVSAATIRSFQVVATLEVRDGPDAALVADRAAEAAREYADERHRLGRDIVVDALRARLYVEGVERVTLDEPADDIETRSTAGAESADADAVL